MAVLETHYFIAGDEGFKGNILDMYLAAGYYRTQHLIFTCVETQAHEDSYPIPVFWLRTSIAAVKEKRAATAIRKKCKDFSVAIKPAILTEEIENLYQRYRNHVPFSTSTTCAGYLHQTQIPNPFDSWMVEVRDKHQLIAVGFFDKGETSIAGIMNMYHPDYHAYSLGKFIMLQKLDAAKAEGKTWYYTGYISTAITRFDYKTFPDENAVEVYLPIEKKWIPYGFMGKENLQEYYMNYLV